jgi:hypothetical protein
MKKEIIYFMLAVFMINLAFAVGETSYCCEKTITGASCQNAAQDQCDSNFRSVPTSCEATSYCKMGCCYDSQEGTCMQNTPQKNCETDGGVWAEESNCEIPQCSLGCCLIGDQAAFVTQTRCKRLSSLYGLQIDFRTNIASEVECIATATSDVEGACVYEEDYARTCKFTTKRECDGLGATSENTTSTDVEFHEGFLCSADELATNCGPTQETVCVQDKDEVWFVDSCGNLANIYDSSKINDKNYWAKVYTKSESCSYGKSNADSASCGSCDYYLGTTCKAYERSTDKSRPNYGDNICRDLACEYEGVRYEHGETWCADAQGIDNNVPGSRYFRLVCYNGEVSVEACADYRQEICLQSEVNGFKTAGCVANKWQDCVAQSTQEDCENTDQRDCKWMEGILIGQTASSAEGTSSSSSFSNTSSKTITGNVITGAFLGIGESDKGEKEGKECKEDKDCAEDLYCKDGFCSTKGSCVPKYSPGFNFWEDGDAESICSQANTQCIVTYEKRLIGEKTCIENCECLEDSWEDEMNKACVALGDCGSNVNYIGVQGYNNSNVVRRKSGDLENSTSSK